jgi:uncharacterized membrane protein
MTSLSRLRLAVLACTTGLILLCLAWELFLAPQRPGGSLLALKALPLIAALPAFLGGRVRAYQWWSMLILLYLCEGVVRGMSDASPISRTLGWTETLLSVLAYGAIVAYVRKAQASEAAQASATATPTAGRSAGSERGK